MGRPPPSKSPAKKRLRAEPAPAVAQPPAEITSFIGRADDLHAITQRFEHSARLLTVIGPGGVGKTRLARRFVAAHAAAFQRGGVSFCELAEARTLDDILRIVGAALGVPPPRGGTSLEHSGQLARALAQRGRALVVLDNFEHIVALAPDTVGAWLRSTQHTCFLVTSREALGIEGEARHELAPLDEGDALALFQDRARARVAAFRLDGATRPAAIEIVRRLDHLPLAIELAATRVGVLTPREIGERLLERFKLLRSDRRDVTARQATLRAAIDWSWRLLAPDEQRALAQVAVFRGGFSPAAAEAVIDLGADAAWPLDALYALHQKSLLVAGPAPGAPEETRFEVLESIREFASGELDRSGERARAELRHAMYWVRVAEERALRARGPEASASVAWFDRELENLLAAHRATASAEPGLAARIALALEIFLTARGLQELVREVHASMVACAEKSGDRRLLARARDAGAGYPQQGAPRRRARRRRARPRARARARRRQHRGRRAARARPHPRLPRERRRGRGAHRPIARDARRARRLLRGRRVVGARIPVLRPREARGRARAVAPRHRHLPRRRRHPPRGHPARQPRRAGERSR